MSGVQPVSRRSLFGLAAGGMLYGHLPSPAGTAAVSGRMADPGGADAASPRDRTAIDVAGPRDGALAAWARTLQAPLADGLAEAGQLELLYRGGVDGVTAANQFDARAVPDGRDALMFCGTVPLAWLTDGDRVRLNPGHLLPLLGVFGPGVLMVRNGRALPAGTAAPRLRLAVGPEPYAGLMALLGLDLMGIPATAVRVHGDEAAMARAGIADAVFVHGAGARGRALALAQAGFRPALTMPAPNAGDRAGAGAGDGAGDGATSAAAGAATGNAGLSGLAAPAFLSGLSADRLRRDNLVVAWRAMAASCAVCAALAVPRLTPAVVIGRWRRAVARSIADDAVTARAERDDVRVAGGDEAADALSPMKVDLSVQLALRRWLAERSV